MNLCPLSRMENLSQGQSTKLWIGWPIYVIALLVLSSCATGHYTPLESADKEQVEQIKEHIYRVEYQVSPFTSQEQLDEYLRRRCAELTVREGYDLFHLTQRADVLGLSRRTSMTVTMYKGTMPVGVTDLIDARALLGTLPPSRSGEK